MLQHCATIDHFAGRFRREMPTIDTVLNLIEATERATGKTVALYLSGLEGRTVCLIMQTYALWVLGRFREAAMAADRLRARLTQVDQVDTRGCALAWLATYESLAGDSVTALDHAEEAARLAARREDGILFVPFAHLALGREHAFGGDCDRGATEIRRGLAALLPSWHPFGYAFLAEVLTSAGDWEGAQAAAARGLAESARTGMLYYDAELLRLQAVAAWHAGGQAADTASREWLRRARNLARRQGSRWLKLRATVSLYRHSLGAEGASTMKRLLTLMEREESQDLRAARLLISQRDLCRPMPL